MFSVECPHGRLRFRTSAIRFAWTVDHCRILDASQLMREGILGQGVTRAGTWQWTRIDTGEVTASIDYRVDTSSDPALHLTYNPAEGAKPLNEAIGLETTRPHRGGLRWWFTCPLVVDGERCGRRVQKLYLPHSGRYFGCRHCYELSYESKNKDARMRAISKAQRIRRRLGGSPSIHEPFPEKPIAMWERTYNRLRDQRSGQRTCIGR